MNEILHLLTKNGNISPESANAILDIVEMETKRNVLANHNYKIFQDKSGRYITYFRDENGRKQVSSYDLNDLNEKLYRLYIRDGQYTFRKCFEAWEERQANCGRSPNTIYKYDKDYVKFFMNYPFERLDIWNITEDVIISHLRTILDDYEVPYSTLKNVWSYIRGVFRKAKIDKIIDANFDPCAYIDIQMFKKYCKEKPIKKASERTLSAEEVNELIVNLNTPNENVNWVSNWGVELALYTGMRVGEIAGLLWDDIDFDANMIIIQHSEKLDKLTRERYLDETKTRKPRIFPLTEDIIRILDKIRDYQKEHRCQSEYVFYNENGRVNAQMIGCCARSKTKNFKSGAKSIHAIRRTFNSNLRKNGVSSSTAAMLLGHSERVNEECYTYDIIDILEKAKMVKEATAYRTS